jgi:hypothetical protein
MGKRLMTTLATIGLMLALSFPIVAPVQAQQGQQNPKTARGQGRERHPEIREAMRALNHAKQELTKEAASDFGGHKAKAVEHINQALDELREALQADKK